MIKSKGIFAVSFIAMMVVGGAYANIASQGYVDQQVDAKQNASTAVKVATAGTAVGDATHPVYVNASGVATRIDKVAAAANADTATSATKATQDASGNNIVSTYATKNELTSGLAGKQATLTSAQLNAVNSGITSAKVSTYDGYNAKITAAQDTADSKVATAQGSGNANKAVITNASGNITTGTIASGMIANDAVTSAKIATGAVGADALAANAVTSAKIADGTITNADIATNAAIAKTKLASDVQTSLGKADTAIQSDDLAQVATSGSYNDLTDKPTIPTAITVDSALSSTSTNPVQNKVVNAAIDAAQSTADDAADAASAAQSTATAAQNAINNLDVSTASGSGNVVTSVTQSNGKISVTKGNVQIPVGSATATSSYATIWVQ